MKFLRTVWSTPESIVVELLLSEILIFALFVPSLAAVTTCLASFIFLEGSKVVS